MDIQALRHSGSHVLAQAVLRLFPNTKLAIGPAIDNGFYYDFDVEKPFSPQDLESIETEMKKIVKENLKIERFTLSREEALETFKDQPYKLELINEIEDELSFYKQGEFVDLCAGPHVSHTGRLKAFRLTSATGAYWRGNEKNSMLCRVYAACFATKDELNAYLEAVEEAKKRDHNKLGRDLGIFTTSELIGQGLPLIMPKGAQILQTLIRFVEDEETRRGYVRTRTPYMAKSDLYKLSGHWDHYRDGMFVLGDEDDCYALRPMTCPFQFMIYNAGFHSYRDLPIRYAETSTLFRNESSGEMHGLIRVRQFTISEGHLVCTEDQLADEFKNVVDLIKFMMEKLGISDDITYRFSKHDPQNKDKYIDNDQAWASSERKMQQMLDELGIDYTEAIGEAAFYGPKLDIQFKNVHGKEDTIITAQIDFSLGERLGMVYVDSDGTKKSPFIIHRTSIGCYERTLAMLIEKYAGAFPFWLAPVQAIILPIAEAHHMYAREVYDELFAQGIRVEMDLRNEKVGKKIREAQLGKIPYMLVVGDNEMENKGASVRCREQGDLGFMRIDDWLALNKGSDDKHERK